MQRRNIWVTLFSVAIVVTALYHTRTVHAAPIHNHHRDCSVASLKGTYAFRRTGVNNVVGGPIAAIGIEVFNGDGTLGLTRYTRSTNGEIQDWTDIPPIGEASYTVDRDCTGSLFAADGTRTNNIIVLDGGKRFSLLSVFPDTITTEEGQRLEGRDCSVASLNGTYAFRRIGVNIDVGGPIAQIGIAFYKDGMRGLIRTTRSGNGEIRPWTDYPTNGSYTIDPDCTGSLFYEDGGNANNLVVLDGGKRFFLLSVLPGTITTEEGIRLEEED
jgi:hypothetical protein